MYRFVLLFGLAACAPGNDLVPVTDDEVPYQPACDVTVVRTLPANGARDAYWRGAIEFELSEPDPTAEVYAPFEGVQTTREGGRIVVFTPTEPLAPETAYTVGLDYCYGAPEITFETSSYGVPLEAPEAVAGRTYVAELSSARFPAGSGLADIAASFFTERLLFGVVEASESAITLRVALATEHGEVDQDTCFRTLDLPAATWKDGPYFEVSVEDVVFGAYTGDITLHDLAFSGTLSEDGASVGGGTFRATVDARELAKSLGLGSAESLCKLAEEVGLDCVPCPDGGEACATLEADSIEATLVPDLELERIAASDIDPECAAE